MHNKKIITGAFILMVLVQLYVPFSMIGEREKILKKGKPFRFETAPVDPIDPFRGEYIRLSYTIEEFQREVFDTSALEAGQIVYAILREDPEGFAMISELSTEPPESGSDYLKVSIAYMLAPGSERVRLDFPFDRFYMEEITAGVAEAAFNTARGDSTARSYALVYVRDGRGVIADLIIQGIPVSDVVSAGQVSDEMPALPELPEESHEQSE